jgi:hypothetical protein
VAPQPTESRQSSPPSAGASSSSSAFTASPPRLHATLTAASASGVATASMIGPDGAGRASLAAAERIAGTSCVSENLVRVDDVTESLKLAE